MEFKLLNKKDFDLKIKESYGVQLPRAQFFQFSKEKIRIFTGNLSERELRFLGNILRIEAVGLYFAFTKDDELRISFDSSFLMKDATKNVIELDEEQARQWMAGEEIKIEEEQERIINYIDKQEVDNIKEGAYNTDQDVDKKKGGINNYIKSRYILLRYNQDILGCGKVAENKILNFVPKERRFKY
jgi:NOL1/NOP2/fmu family ribosome biogenesis protein